MTTTSDVDQLLERAEVLIDLNRHESALEIVSQAASIEPGNPRTQAVACRALMGLGRHDQAVLAAQQAARLDPSSSHSLRLLALALVREADARGGRPSEHAIATAQEAVRLAPHDVNAYMTLAEVQAKAGRISDADAAIRRAIALAPGAAGVWVTASLVAIRARNWFAAEKAARRALAIDTNESAATNNLGVALDSQGYWPLAAVAFLDAARNDPRAFTARANVERVGFKYLSTIVPLLLLPLLIIFPVFLAARLALTSWLSKKPARLRPLALRLGLRVAGSRRRQRRFERHNAHIQRAMANPAATVQWSALAGHRRVSNGLLGLGGGGLLMMGLMFLAVEFTGTADGSLAPILLAVGLIAGGALTLGRLRRRYTHG